MSDPSDLIVLFASQGRIYNYAMCRRIETSSAAIAQRFFSEPDEAQPVPELRGKTDLECLWEMQGRARIDPIALSVGSLAAAVFVTAFIAGFIFLLK